MNNRDFVFGFVEEQSAFEERNREFVLETEALRSLMEQIFYRPLPLRSDADLVVYVLGRMALESFGAIYLLSTNSYGLEAKKLLRAMYEETVTMAYLAKNPSDTERFVKYAKSEREKFARTLKGAHILFKDGAHESLWQKIMRDYKEIADQFTGKRCSKCGQKPMPSWTNLSIEAMAEKAGNNLKSVYIACYVSATKRTHAAPISVAGHIEEDTQGNISFKPPSPRFYADSSVMYAHWLLVTVLEVQDEFFSLGFKEKLSEHDARLNDIWNTAKMENRAAEFISREYRDRHVFNP